MKGAFLPASGKGSTSECNFGAAAGFIAGRGGVDNGVALLRGLLDKFCASRMWPMSDATPSRRTLAAASLARMSAVTLWPWNSGSRRTWEPI